MKVRVFFSFLSRFLPLFHCWKQKGRPALSLRGRTAKIDHMHNYSLRVLYGEVIEWRVNRLLGLIACVMMKRVWTWEVLRSRWLWPGRPGLDSGVFETLEPFLCFSPSRLGVLGTWAKFFSSQYSAFRLSMKFRLPTLNLHPLNPLNAVQLNFSFYIVYSSSNEVHTSKIFKYI
jgi:hypothetical protein